METDPSSEPNPEGEEVKAPEDTNGARNDMQTYIFSATMSKDLQKNLKKFKRSKGKDRATTLGRPATSPC